MPRNECFPEVEVEMSAEVEIRSTSRYLNRILSQRPGEYSKEVLMRIEVLYDLIISHLTIIDGNFQSHYPRKPDTPIRMHHMEFSMWYLTQERNHFLFDLQLAARILGNAVDETHPRYFLASKHEHVRISVEATRTHKVELKGNLSI